jgi:hypothetical protein
MKRIQPAHEASDWDAKAAEALEIARLIGAGESSGPEKAGMSRNAARHTRAFLCEARQAAEVITPAAAPKWN